MHAHSHQGTAAVAALAVAVHSFWSVSTLLTWTFFECPYWGLATAAAALCAPLGHRLAAPACPVVAAHPSLGRPPAPVAALPPS